MALPLRRLVLERMFRTTQISTHQTSTRRIAALAVFCVTALVSSRYAAADNARFDLTGPKVEIRVARAGMTLPIASVPNLQPGDRIWLHPDLPESQSIHYLMVLVFLRGTTNPPPDKWFNRIEAWDKKVRSEGVEIVVPDEAQQAVLFLAPVTGGDFSTLRSAVQGRPGIFVRASQDLSLAGFEQARIEKYIASMHEVPQAELSDPKALQEHSNVIAGTLALKPNGDCTKLAPDQQYNCLTQTGNQTLLDDGHGQSIVSAISSGPGSDFINAASATSLAGGGVYSAYVGAIVDLVRIMGSLHTAQYQYIPAIAFPQAQALNLRLNTAPSFHNPKSVIVIGLPSVQATSAPPLRPSDPHQVSCLAKPGVVLPVEGAPLVFSTGFAHDLVLHINYPEGAAPASAPQDVPLTADAFRGGLVLATTAARKPLPLARVTLPTAPPNPADNSAAKPAEKGSTPKPVEPAPGELTATVEGFWGFDTFKGPTMRLQRVPGKDWKLDAHDPIIAGESKEQHVLLSSTGTACIQTIGLATGSSKSEPETWKAAPDKPNTVDVALKLSDGTSADARTLHLAIRQFGSHSDDSISLTSYAEAAKLSSLAYHSGDTTAQLSGSSLDQIKSVRLGSSEFAPSPDPSASTPGLRLSLNPGVTPPSASSGEHLTAQVTLKDGRTLPLPVTIGPTRPTVTLINKADVPPPGAAPQGLRITLGSPDNLPVSHSLLFSLSSTRPFPRDGRLEVASNDGGFHAILNVEAATLILADPHTVLGKLNPTESFGSSAFGPIHVRAVFSDGTAGDWISLVTLVRLPVITAVSCPAAPAAAPAQPAPAPPSAEAPASTPPSTDAATKPPAAEPAATPQPAAPQTCTLSGSDLYLIDSVSSDQAFASPTHVAEGFVAGTLQVPAPQSGHLYLRLRDDRTQTDTVEVPPAPAPPVTPAPPAAQ